MLDNNNNNNNNNTFSSISLLRESIGDVLSEAQHQNLDHQSEYDVEPHWEWQSQLESKVNIIRSMVVAQVNLI